MITIRKAAESDAQDIFDIRSRAIVEKCSAYYSEEQLSIWTQGGMSDGFISDVVETFHVSEVDGRVIGSGKINIETGMVDAIFVDPDFSGKGAAKQMLQFLEELAIQHNLPLMKLESTLNAATFYRSCGFIGDELSTYHSPRGISLDCIPMEKPVVAQINSANTNLGAVFYFPLTLFSNIEPSIKFLFVIQASLSL